MPFIKLIYNRFRGIFSLNDAPYWVSAALAGLAAVAYAKLFLWAEQTTRKLFVWNKWSLFLVTPLALTLSWALVRYLAPRARGSGIPQVMGAIRHVASGGDASSLHQLLSLRTLIVKVVSSLLAVLGGAAVGREGPTIQISAGIFYAVRQRFASKTGRVLNAEAWLVAGGAAGLSAAFNTPLGGLVFAIEELASSHFNKFKTSLISAVIIAGLTAQLFAGSYLYLGYPRISPFSLSLLPLSILVGVVCGLCGAFFGKLLFVVTQKRDALPGGDKTKAAIAVGCGLLLAAMAVLADARALGPGKEVVHELIFQPKEGGDYLLAAERFFMPIVSYVAGGAGGIFAPALAAGAALGKSMAHIGGFAEPTLFVILGMIAFLTGLTHSPFTAFVLVLEMTDRHSAIMPMMVAAAAAMIASRLVDEESFYERVRDEYALLFARIDQTQQNQSAPSSEPK